MLWLLLVVLVLLLVFGGVGYGRRAALGNRYAGGVGLLAGIMIVLLALFALGVLRP
jgi:hypothetical protein